MVGFIQFSAAPFFTPGLGGAIAVTGVQCDGFVGAVLVVANADAFVSGVEATGQPKPYPTDGKMYGWDEATLSWVESQIAE